jgi:hypothetical protein
VDSPTTSQHHAIWRGTEFIIRDNDSKSGSDIDRIAKGAGLRVLRTAVQAALDEFSLRKIPRKRSTRMLGSHRHIEHDTLNACCPSIANISKRVARTKDYDNEFQFQSRPRTMVDGAGIRSVAALGGLHHDYQVAA